MGAAFPLDATLGGCGNGRLYLTISAARAKKAGTCASTVALVSMISASFAVVSVETFPETIAAETIASAFERIFPDRSRGMPSFLKCLLMAVLDSIHTYPFRSLMHIMMPCNAAPPSP